MNESVKSNLILPTLPLKLRCRPRRLREKKRSKATEWKAPLKPLARSSHRRSDLPLSSLEERRSVRRKLRCPLNWGMWRCGRRAWVSLLTSFRTFSYSFPSADDDYLDDVARLWNRSTTEDQLGFQQDYRLRKRTSLQDVLISFFELSAPQFTPTSTLLHGTEYADGERWFRREGANRKDRGREGEYRFVLCNARWFRGVWETWHKVYALQWIRRTGAGPGAVFVSAHDIPGLGNWGEYSTLGSGMFLRQVESQIEVEFEVEFEAEVGVDELDISRGGSVQSSVLLIVLQEQLRRLEGITAAGEGEVLSLSNFGSGCGGIRRMNE